MRLPTQSMPLCSPYHSCWLALAPSLKTGVNQHSLRARRVKTRSRTRQVPRPERSQSSLIKDPFGNPPANFSLVNPPRVAFDFPIR